MRNLLRRLDPRRRYTVRWREENGQVGTYVGSFGACDRLLRVLLADRSVHTVAAFRPDGVDDTWLFPAACSEDFPATVEPE